MIFRPELAAKVMSGDKTVTRRLCNDNPRSPWWREACRSQPGRSEAVQPGRGIPAIGRVLVSSVRRETLTPMMGRAGNARSHSDAEARREGFADAAAFREAWIEINGSWDPLAEVWRVEFVVCDGGSA